MDTVCPGDALLFRKIKPPVKVSDLHPFENPPFHVNEDKDMRDLAGIVRQFGVMEPVTVIPREIGGCEIVSGHRCKRACELAGITDIPVIVCRLDRDEATIAMVDANLKRENTQSYGTGAGLSIEGHI